MSRKTKKSKKLRPEYPEWNPANWIPWHRPKQFVMTIGACAVYGGSIFDLGDLADVALVVDLSGVDNGCVPSVTGNKGALNLCPDLLVGLPPILFVDWVDGGVPTLQVTWWLKLLDVIERQPKGSAVCVCCVGGSGRTGTALTILAALAGLIDDNEDPVEWLRHRYHGGAVETVFQISYIEKITGRMVMTDAVPGTRRGVR